ncbi:AcrR family transcriptional regulator [Crossiella equi]|uniref:AcrR family transcriptional regulator n=1 Tax=Crossiella equi TaxID=130796 RepID=A0ABS5A4B9_9PSEU|nr:TetR family transcriptional regulator [Crossiella equi]MBP2471419.1 AcrR family transcriptional regulator [Crossiella equi]
MSSASRPGSRDIARKAVRSELAAVALELFAQHGFDAVTVNDLAAASGVSRSTFLRYFASKEETVLTALDSCGELLARAVREQPAGTDDWTVLRRALGVLVERYQADVPTAVQTTRLVAATPALCAQRLEKQHGWRPEIADALIARGTTPTVAAVRASAALACLEVAIERWADEDGQPDLGALLDEAFTALAAR